MSLEKNKEIARNVCDAITNNDGKFMMTTFADDVSFWIAGSLPELSGTHDKNFLAELGRQHKASFPNGLTLTVTGVTAEGDRVAVEAESNGVHANGMRYNNFYHILMVIRDGKIHQWKEYMDTMHAGDVLLNGVV